MKVTDVTLTMFTWKVPSGITSGSLQSPSYGTGEIAVVTISTDEGIEGHSFLGSAMRRANIEAPALLAYLKPVLMGQNPLDIGRLWRLKPVVRALKIAGGVVALLVVLLTG